MKTKMLRRFFAFTMSAFVLISSANGTTAFASANSETAIATESETTENKSVMTETAETTENESVVTETAETESVEETELVEIATEETAEAEETETTEVEATELTETGAVEETETVEIVAEESETTQTEVTETTEIEEIEAAEETEATEVVIEEVTEDVIDTSNLMSEEERFENIAEISALDEEMLLNATTITPGTSQSGAKAINLNTTYQAKVNSSGDRHWYKYTLTTAGLVEINSQNLGGGTYYVYLNQNGNSCESSYTVNGGEHVTGRKLGLEAGTYYIYVGGFYALSGETYQLSLNFTPLSTCETESNDTFSSADTIPVNTLITGSSHSGSEEDYYKFTLNAPGAVDIQLTHDAISGREMYDEYTVYFYNSTNGNDLFYFYSTGGDKTVTSTKIGLPAGDYYVLVDGGYYNTGTYGLKVNYEQSNTWEQEVNSTATLANTISVNQSYAGTVITSSDADYYKFTVDNDGMVSLNVKHDGISGLETSRCYRIYLYSANDLSNAIYYMYSNGGETSKTSPQIGLPKGTYYVMVDGYYSDYYTPYQLKVNYTKSSYWEKEGNDTFTSATSIKADKTYKGSIRTSNDVDYYKVKVSNDGYINLKLKQSGTTTDYIYTIKLYNSDLNEVYADKIAGTDNKYETSKIGLKKGTYYVYICNYNTYEGTYELTVDATKASNWEKEINNDKSAANKISVGKTVKGVTNGGYYGTYDSYDYYKFTLSKSTYINVSLEHERVNGTDNMWAVDIYDSKGNIIDDFSASYMYVKESEEYVATQTTKLSKGTYYVKVYGYGAATDEEYELTVNKVEKKAPTISSVESTQYNKIKVSWKAVPGATKYEIYRATSKNGSYKKVKTISDGSTTSWTDKDVKTGKTYYYKMKSVVETNKVLKSGYSKVKSAKCVPATPSVSLKSSTKKQMKVSWKKVSGASGYEIYRATSKSGKYTKVTTIKKGSTTNYTDKKLTSGKTYYYKVRAYRTVDGKKVYSSYSDIKSKKVK